MAQLKIELKPSIPVPSHLLSLWSLWRTRTLSAEEHFMNTASGLVPATILFLHEGINHDFCLPPRGITF